MKKEVSKNKKLGLIIAIAAVVLLAVAGVVLALVLGGGNAGKEEKFESKLYWNIDGKSMLSEETAMSTRKAAEDGLYYIRYLVGGEIVEIPFADKKLVTQADRAEITCLKFDADGIAIELVDPEELYVRIQDKTYVQAVNGNQVTLNTSTVLNGMKKQFTLPEGVPIVNVSTRTGTLEIGEKVTELDIFDQLLIYGTDEETITDVFLTDRYWTSEIYWSTGNRQYWDATNKVSTRPLAEDGYWYIDLICKGERKTYKVAEQDCIDVLDSKGPTDAATGVVFDEDGAIVNLFNAGIACRGTLAVNSYDITQLSEDGKTFTATRIMFGTEIGKTFTGTVTEDTQIYNMNSTADYLGQPTELQMDDRLLVYTKADGSIHTIFVVNRMVDSPFYYNLNQKWSSVNGLTRTPDEDGYYVYELAVDGKVKTVRTKSKELATQMDSYNLKVFGLKLKGDIVVKVYDAVAVAGNWSFASNNFVTTTEGGILGTVSTSGTASNGVMSADCKVFDVSQCYKNFRGEKTTVREGDQILAYQNAVGEVTHIWVLNRYVKGTTIYWNMNRYYANGETTRTPDADGYYVFNVIKAGTTKVIQLKTKDKEVANRFDKEGSTTAAALKVKGDIIQAAYPAPAAIGGYYRLSGFWVHELNTNDTPGTHALIARTGAIGNIVIADDCKIMNFSQIVNKATGESTQLKVGDYVWPIAGQDGKIHYIFIVEREVVGSKLAWRKNTLATLKDADGNVLKDKDGNNMLQADENGYYVFTLWVNGKIGTYKTKDLKLANYVNGRATGFAVSVKGDTITGAYPISSEPNTRASSVSYYDYVKTVDGVMTLKRNRVGQTDTGNEMTVNVTSGYKAYNFDPAAGDDWGKQVKLTKGDRVYAYSNNAGESYIFFIMYDCTLEGGNERYCDHCGKKVHWESVFAGYSPAAGCAPEVAHYYLPTDYEGTGWTLGNATQQAEGVATEIVFDLNGKTLTRKGTPNATDGKNYASGAVLTAGYGNTLIVNDYSKSKTGKLVTKDDVIYTGAASLLHVQSGSTLIVDGGVVDARKGTVNYTAANGGTVSVGGTLIVNGGTVYGRASNGNGGVIGSWGGSNIVINGGTLIGSKMTEGVAGYTGFGGVIAANGNLTVTGGTIKGGTGVKGDNIYVGNANSEVVISGGTIDGGIEIAAAKSVTLSGKPQIAAGKNYGLKVAGSIKIDATGLKAGASVYVDASGVFTTDFASAKEAQKVIDNGMLKAGAEGMMLKVEGKAIASVPDGKIREWTDTTKLPDMGRWKLGVDVVTEKVSSVSGELYIDLNGHDITRNVAESALGSPMVFNVGSGNKLTVTDTSAAADGTVSICVEGDKAINAYGAVIHIPDGGTFVLEGGIIDGSNVDNTYVNANNGTISVGGKLIVNGGTVKGLKRGSANGGAIGAWAGTEIVINGGKIVAGGSFLNNNAAKTQKVNGAAIATTGKLTINGGEIVGPGATSDPEKRARSGGLIYANGDSLTILGGKFYDGYGTGYGFNIYYERNYLGTAGADGKRPTVAGGGEVVIGGDAYVGGGVTIRSSKNDDPVKLTVKDNAVIDSTGAVAAVNIRLYNGELFINDDDTAITAAPADTNYDISLVYTCKNVIKGFNTGNTTKYEHTYGDDHICDDCGYDKYTPQPWTDGTKLPTSGNYYLDVDVETTAVTNLSGDLYLDLNGHTVTHKALSNVLATGANKLTIDDTPVSGGKITTTPLSGNLNALINVQANGNFRLVNGTIDGSNITTTYTGANAGTVAIGNGKINGVAAYGAATVEGGKIIGWTSSGNGSAIGMMNLTSLTISGGEIIGGTVTKSINGTGYGGAIMANGHLTIEGGKISGGSATTGGDNIFVNNASANVIISGGEIDGGVTLNNYASCVISGTVKINEGTNYGLKIPANKTVDLSGLTGGEVYVDATGVFTANFASNDAATAALAFVKAGDPTMKVAADGLVLKTVELLSISLDKTSVTLEIGEDATVTATADPAAATVTWTSSDEAVATVVNGKITAVSAGTATVTATADYNGIRKTATVSVTVKAPQTQEPMESQAWVDWTDGTKLPTAGKYKLTTDVTVSAHTLLTGELWIDLNGYTVTRNVAEGQTTKQYVFNVNNADHTLLITDLSGKTGDELGKITASYASGVTCGTSGGLIQVDLGQLILDNGIIDGTPITANITTANNAAVMISDRFTMNGGIIKGQYSKKYTSSGQSGSAVGAWGNSDITINGGTIQAYQVTGSSYACSSGGCIATSGKLTINGGELIGSRTGARGGAIYATKAGTNSSVTINGGTIKNSFGLSGGAIFADSTPVTILGGSIIGNKASQAANGHSIDAYKNTLTIGGNAVISGGVTVRGGAKLVLKDAPVVDDNLGTVYANITLNSASAYLNDTTGTAFQTANGNYSLTYGKDGKVSGLAAYAANAQTESATIPTAGNVKLTADVTLTEAIVTTGNLTIDLNGHTVTMTGSTFAIKASHNVIITDSSAEKTGKIATVPNGASFTSDAAVLYITAGKKAVLVGGTLDGSAVTNGFSSSYAGTVTVGNNASFIMVGGEVKGQKSSSTGSTGKGGSCIGGWGSSITVINGGKLTAPSKGTTFPTHAIAAQGTCISSGGDVFVHGGELYGTMAQNHGGNIYCTGNLTITGGLISGGYANNSGLISCSGASCTITGGTFVGGTAHAGSALGGASIDYAKSGGVLTIGGSAKIAGGVSIRAGAKLVLTGKAVIDMNMAGQTQKKFNVRIQGGTGTSIYLDSATGTAIATAVGMYDVNYDAAGIITGVTPK